MTACQCGHREDLHHPAGVCVVELPPFEEEELPAWRCPCRRFRAEQLPLDVLRSVQSCTVLPAPRPADLRERPRVLSAAAAEAVRLLGRTPA